MPIRMVSACSSLRKTKRICPRCTVAQSLPYSSYCRPCATKIQIVYMKNKGRAGLKKWRAKIRQLITDAKSKPCSDCKKRYPWYVMDFDHCRAVKHFNLSAVTSHYRGVEKVQAEIAKCDVVCSNCHRIRTFTRMKKPHAGE